MSQPDLWKRYRVQWQFITKLCGQTPSDPEIVKKWLDARKPKVRPPDSKSITEIQEEVFATLPEEEPEFVELIFQRHPETRQLCFRASTIKSHLKDCARILSTLYIGKIEGEKSFATKVVNGVYPDPQEYFIPVLKNGGTPLVEADGKKDVSVHAPGPRGMQNSLKRFEYVNDGHMSFTLQVIQSKKGTPCVSREDLETLMLYGGTHGYAGERSGGEGKYIATIEEIDK